MHVYSRYDFHYVYNPQAPTDNNNPTIVPPTPKVSFITPATNRQPSNQGPPELGQVAINPDDRNAEGDSTQISTKDLFRIVADTMKRSEKRDETNQKTNQLTERRLNRLEEGQNVHGQRIVSLEERQNEDGQRLTSLEEGYIHLSNELELLTAKKAPKGNEGRMFPNSDSREYLIFELYMHLCAHPLILFFVDNILSF